MPTYAAVDLGATSGRVVNVSIDRDGIELSPVSRFANEISIDDDGMATWDLPRLLDEIVTALAEAQRISPARSMAVDSWAVDYGLLDQAGRLVGPVHAYRSKRTDGVMETETARLNPTYIYGITGIQFLPFNTVFQLIAAASTDDYRHASTMLMIPDLINHILCGSTTNELTNASTTQLLDARTRAWSDELVLATGLRRDLLPELHQPGTSLGTLDWGVGSTGFSGLPIVAVASHDTASAVVGTPLRPNRPAVYISCGTWALVGCELDAPITSDLAQQANVTNELGWNGTTRLLKNVTGLWLLEQCRKHWSMNGIVTGTVELIAAASRLVGVATVFDPDSPSLVVTENMPAAIRFACRQSGQPEPVSPAEIARSILNSLALRFRQTVRLIEDVAGMRAEVIHLVGGGSSNELLAQLTASACDRPVLAGPAEATVVGNALIQAVADGQLTDIEQGRRLVERSRPPRVILPESIYDWQALEDLVGGEYRR